MRFERKHEMDFIGAAVIFVIGSIFGFTACSVIVCACLEEVDGGADDAE